jgi:phage host-nuclease inhibitor protein Gam
MAQLEKKRVGEKVSIKERRRSVGKSKKQADPSASKQNPDSPGSQAVVGIQTGAEEVSEASSVDRIRDIIFGNQMQDYERRFARLEERIMQEIGELRENAGNRLDSLETYINKEVESVNDRIKAEQDKRAETVNKVAKELKDAVKSITKNIERLEEKLGKDSHELRQQLLDQSKNLSSEIQKKYKEVSAALDQAALELRDEKVDRAMLSELLMEMAVRISSEMAEKFNLAADRLRNG